MPRTSSMPFDVRSIPFSARGAWFNLSPVVGLHQHADSLHLVSHRTGMHALVALQPHAPTTWHADPTRLAWLSAQGQTIEATFDGPETIRLRGHGLGMTLADAAGTLTPFGGNYLYVEPLDGSAVLTSYETGRRLRITPLAGSFRVVGAEVLGGAERTVVVGEDGEPWELALRETTSAARPFVATRTFDEAMDDSARTFTSFLDDVAPWRSESTPAANLAAYVLWSATVAPEGFMTRESVLMSKHWMDKLWSWDHCFIALAFAPGLPDAALDQFLAPFDHQDDSGAMPDSITHSEVLYNFVKPPIHGWALDRLRRNGAGAVVDDNLEEIFDRLCRWTTFWLDYRRAPGRRLPYYQHGNDSGWDNSTTFDNDRVIESPDLAAFLVLQLEAVIGLGEQLGRPVEDWQTTRDEILDALTAELWDGEAFVARNPVSGRLSTSSSLLNLLPLVLADRLPRPLLDAMAARVEEHLTEHGLATEPPTSPLYEPDGYWRGPIWAPSTALIEDGLRRSGFVELADRVSERFRALCERSGFAENFDAVTGEGLRDRAYTWTASVYLTLAADHVARTDSADTP